MQHKDAASLLKAIYGHADKATWAELGCGTGTFTKALAELLAPGSTLYAIDKNKEALKSIPASFNEVHIQREVLDFAHDDIPFQNLEGILMANALHFINDKTTLLKKITPLLIDSGQLILIEYNMTKPNPWVPYPIPFEALQNLVSSTRFNSIIKIGETPSRYHQAHIYAAQLTF